MLPPDNFVIPVIMLPQQLNAEERRLLWIWRGKQGMGQVRCEMKARGEIIVNFIAVASLEKSSPSRYVEAKSLEDDEEQRNADAELRERQAPRTRNRAKRGVQL